VRTKKRFGGKATGNDISTNRRYKRLKPGPAAYQRSQGRRKNRAKQKKKKRRTSKEDVALKKSQF